MTYDEIQFQRSEDPFADAEDLCAKHGLKNPSALADILMWAEERSYDVAAQGEVDGQMRRPFATELQTLLRTMTACAKRVRELEEDTFEGIGHLAYVDVFGVEGSGRVLTGMAMMSLTEREEPLRATVRLAKIVIAPLAEFWSANGSLRDVQACLAFVRDALVDRWSFPDQSLSTAITRLARRVGYSRFDNPW